MPNLSFQVLGAEPLRFAATPHLGFKLRVANGDPDAVERAIHSVQLNCQIRIEPTRRHYAPDEQERLTDLFGDPHRWDQTLRSMLWTHAQVTVPLFVGEREIDLPVPCTFDFNVGATKYFAAVETGEIPLCLLFSGTIFYAGDDGRLQVAQISWEREADFRLPVRVWHEMMERHYPHTTWLCLERNVFEQLHEYKRRRGLPTWELALEALLAADAVKEQVAP